ncbi:DNA invertase Pin-like site-specific DNA recombinase [Blastococcus colisei]|uniref:DNA invertase Pin-like site-specific DNA recombinase n=1 Tax=Blastococcus colisei TaxID=1564162 RepID=A0A543PK30_9ACTN|nr:recombinase family protein [Blastococcus colisei]TQN44414.1 DNA invertase Pin-like site-specific DNA recombinase [Blastococcus colisei]
MTTRAVIYARQSLDRSGEGAAVDRQTADCRHMAERRGWTVTDTITDNDLSASTGKVRPGYQRLLEAMRAGSLDVVVVWHVDRLTRRLVDLEEVIALCERTGVRLATVTGDLDLSTDTGRMLARILASVARGEVERKGARQRSANAQRAQAGRMGWTRRPFGYDRDDAGQVIVVAKEAAGLKDAAAAVLDGSTLAAAARQLDDRGLTTTARKPWNVTSLRRALLNPRYAGRVTYNGVDVTAGQWPVILDADTQDQLTEVLRDVGRRVQQGTDPKFLLSGLALCGRCGQVMFASPMGAKGKRWMAYRCLGCYIARRQDLVDEVVTAVVLARLSMPDAVNVLSRTEDVSALREEAGELRQRRDDLAALLADGLLSATAVRERSQKLTDQLRELEGRITAALGESPAASLASAEDVAAAWDAMPLRDRKRALSLLLTVTILPVGKGRPFTPDSVQIDWVQA